MSPLSELAGQQLRGAVAEVDVEFAHDLDDLGMDVGGGVPGRERLVGSVGAPARDVRCF